MRLLIRLRNINSYDHKIHFTSKKKSTLKAKLKSTSKAKLKSIGTAINIDEFEKPDFAKNRPIAESHQNFVSSKYSNENCLIIYKRNNREIMTGVDKNKTIRQLFDSLLHRYQLGLEQSMKGSNFVFDYVK